MGEFERLIYLSISQGLTDAWRAFEFVLLNGGWILFALFLGWVIFMRRWIRVMLEYAAGIDWVYLNVVVPKIPSESMMTAELMFNHLHAARRSFQWRDKWLEGMFLPWFSFEIVSLGGVIRYIIRTHRSNIPTVQTAIFSQYPDAEIVEVGDYLEALTTPFNPDEVDYDFWGAEMEPIKNEAYPIKTYQMFEHTAAEAIHDPLNVMLETMANLNPDEMIAIQILAIYDDDKWKEKANKEAQKLKGAPKEGEKKPDQPPSLLMHLSENEKDVIKAIQTKLSKPSFLCKIRFMYAAPKDNLSLGERLPSIFGGWNQFSSYDLNGFKPSSFSITSSSVKYSERLEKKKSKVVTLWRKRAFVKNFKNRNLYAGNKRYHLATDELATIFHFPLEAFARTSVEKSESRRSEAPLNLPT